MLRGSAKRGTALRGAITWSCGPIGTLNCRRPAWRPEPRPQHKEPALSHAPRRRLRSGAREPRGGEGRWILERQSQTESRSHVARVQISRIPYSHHQKINWPKHHLPHRACAPSTVRRSYHSSALGERIHGELGKPERTVQRGARVKQTLTVGQLLSLLCICGRRNLVAVRY